LNLKDLRPTLEDFDRSGWEQVVEEANARLCDRYSDAFAIRAVQLEARDIRASGSLALLACVTSFHLNLQDRQNPFRPIIHSDLANEHLDVLKHLLPRVVDPELHSRVADVLWIKTRPREYQLATEAVKGYLASYSALVGEHSVAAAERLERAFQLAASLGKQQELFGQVARHAENALRALDPKDASYLSHRIMWLLLDFGIGEASIWVAEAENRALRAQNQHTWHWARAFWMLKARWDQQLNDIEAQEKSRIAIAETYVQEAEAEIGGDNTSLFKVAFLLQKAIAAYRLAPSACKREQELHLRLLSIQKESTNELQMIPHDGVDLSGCAEQARASVQGKTLQEAISYFVGLHAQPNYLRIRKGAEEAIKHHPVNFMFPTWYLDLDGRITSNRPPLPANDSNVIEAVTLAEIYRAMQQEREINVIGLIEPIRRQIVLEHNIRPDAIAAAIHFSPFVPEDHVYQIAHGLYYGFAGEFLAATHILIPQIENCVRHVLHQSGIVTSSLSSEGTQESFNLNRLLYLPEVPEIFGDRVVFDMRGLLVEKVGPNYRNVVSHGMLPDALYFIGREAIEAIYLWWLMLRLCLVPLLTLEQHRGETNAPGTEGCGAEGSDAPL
jgi:uncharacterized protein DUF4209